MRGEQAWYFSGATTLPVATSQTAALGVAVLVISLIAKIAAIAAAQSFGFIGGPILPLVFAGGVLGAASTACSLTSRWHSP